MNTADFSGFFYNLIPGSLFIIGLNLLEIDVVGQSTSKIVPGSGQFVEFIAFIIYAIFLGFVFQGIIKLLREIILNRAIFSIVRHINESQYRVAENILADVDGEKLSEKNVFFLMDDFLRGNQIAAGIIHFSSRFAFWSNMLIASVLFLALVKFFPYRQNYPYLDLFSEVIFVFSLIISPFYFYAYYDVVLKTFITTIKINREKCVNRNGKSK